MAVHVGVGIVQLGLAGCGSLKEKRGLLKPLIARLQREFNVAVAETDFHDVWQSAQIALAVVSTAPGLAHAEIQTITHWIERTRPEVEVQEVRYEDR
jgi:hypothetical protein